MRNNLDHLTAHDETENKEAADIAHAYADGFFDDPENSTQVAAHLPHDKEDYEATLDDFFSSDADAHLSAEHRNRFNEHLPISGMVIDKLGKHPHTLTIGTTKVAINNTLQSLQFIRGIIKLTETTYASQDKAHGLQHLFSKEGRKSILTTYENNIHDFLDHYEQPFDTVLYMREQDDTSTFQHPYEHRALYASWGKSIQEYIPGKDFTDGKTFVEQIRTYCAAHAGERILLYLGGHGGKDGSMFFDERKKGTITREDFQALTAIPGLILDIDSCRTGNKLANTSPQSAGILTNSEFDTSKVAYDICLYESQARKFDMKALKKKYPNLSALEKKYNRADNELDFISDHLLDKNLGFLCTLDRYQTYIGDTPTNTFPISTLNKTSIQTTLQRLDKLIATTPDPTTLEITCKSYDNPKASIKIPVIFLRDVMAATTYQHGDYNNDGKVSYGETRVYALQYYKQGFLPTMDQKNGTYISLAHQDTTPSHAENTRDT